MTQSDVDRLFNNDPVLSLPADELSRHGRTLHLATLKIDGVTWKYDHDDMVLAEVYGKKAVKP